MKKSKQGGRRVASYAEAARGGQASSSPAGSTPGLQPPVAEAVSSPAPSRHGIEASTGNTVEQATRPASSRGSASETISGAGSKPSREIAKEKGLTGKEDPKDTKPKPNIVIPNPTVSLEPKEARRTFSYAEAARRGKISNSATRPDPASTTEYPAIPSSGAERVNSEAASVEAASPSPLPGSHPPDMTEKKPNKGKGKEKQQTTQATGSRPPAITPAVPVIDFGSQSQSQTQPQAQPSGSKKKKGKKGKKGNQASAQGSSTNSTLPVAPAQASASSAAVSPEYESVTPGPAEGKRPKRNNNESKKKGKKSASPQSPPSPSQKAMNAPPHQSVNPTPQQAMNLPAHQAMNAPPQQASNPHPAILPATNLPPSYYSYNLDAMVEARIQEAIAQEEERKWHFEQRQLRIKEAIAAHDKKESKLSLWESQYEWDVRVLWRSQDGNESYQWNVHHDILCRESSYFKDRLPPKDPGGGYINFDCSLHSKEQLATVLKWMYDKTYDDARINWANGAGKGHNVPNGEAIRRNVFMYICGASVNCESLMTYAADRLDEISEAILDNNLFTVEFCRSNDLFRFSHPLTLALMMMFEQGHRKVMWTLRLAMARLCDVVLLRMMCNESFSRTLDQEWRPRFLFSNVLNDSIFFRHHDLLFPMEGIDEAGKLELAAAVAMMAQASTHGPVPTIHSIPIARFTDDDTFIGNRPAQPAQAAPQRPRAAGESPQKTKDAAHGSSDPGGSVMTAMTFAQAAPVAVRSSHSTTVHVGHTPTASQSSQPTEAFPESSRIATTEQFAQLAQTSQTSMPSGSGAGVGSSEQSVSGSSNRDYKGKKKISHDKKGKGKMKAEETENNLAQQLGQMESNASPRRGSSASSHTLGRFDLRGGSDGGSESSYTRSGNSGEPDANDKLGNRPERSQNRGGNFSSQDVRQEVGFTPENRRSGRGDPGRADMYRRSREFRQFPPAPAGNFVDYNVPFELQHGHRQHCVNQFGRRIPYERRHSAHANSGARGQYFNAGSEVHGNSQGRRGSTTFHGANHGHGRGDQVRGTAHYAPGYGFGQPHSGSGANHQGPSGRYDKSCKRRADSFAVSESGWSTGSETYPYPPYWEVRNQMDRAAAHTPERCRVDPARGGPGFHPQGPPQFVYNPATTTAPMDFTVVSGPAGFIPATTLTTTPEGVVMVPPGPNLVPGTVVPPSTLGLPIRPTWPIPPWLEFIPALPTRPEEIARVLRDNCAHEGIQLYFVW